MTYKTVRNILLIGAAIVACVAWGVSLHRHHVLIAVAPTGLLNVGMASGTVYVAMSSHGEPSARVSHLSQEISRMRNLRGLKGGFQIASIPHMLGHPGLLHLVEVPIWFLYLLWSGGVILWSIPVSRGRDAEKKLAEGNGI